MDPPSQPPGSWTLHSYPSDSQGNLLYFPVVYKMLQSHSHELVRAVRQGRSLFQENTTAASDLDQMLEFVHNSSSQNKYSRFDIHATAPTVTVIAPAPVSITVSLSDSGSDSEHNSSEALTSKSQAKSLFYLIIEI